MNKKANTLDQYNSVISIHNKKRAVYNQDFDIENFPVIIYPDNQFITVWQNIYKRIWNRIQFGNKNNNFSEYYYDEAKDDCMYQWDTCFAEIFLMFGNNILPSMASIDNFYKIQNEKGFIPRLLKRIDGQPTGEFRRNNPLINPPLFSYVEYKYYELTGNTSRLYKIHKNLDDYFEWIEENLSLEKFNGLYYNTLLGSGMDTLPRHNLNKNCVWIDMSAQQALSALTLSKIHKAISNNEKSEYYNNKYNTIKNAINTYCWSEEDEFYYDVLENGTYYNKQTAAALWTIIAEIPDENQINSLVKHLMNPKKFFRKNVIPTLPADDNDYTATGWYWKSGVWSNINYIVIEGLQKYNKKYEAYQLTKKNIINIIDVFFNFKPDPDKISPNENSHKKNSFWEAYAPDFAQPALRWDNNYYCRPNFVLWTALTIINLFVENILGFNFFGINKTISLKITEIDNNYRGIIDFIFLDKPMSIKYKLLNNKLIINYKVFDDVLLNINYLDRVFQLKLNPNSDENTNTNTIELEV